ncbi:acetolactate synthase-1/2/3 large subunit [Stella humosa]|uniref:Acetolactate synthase-1/2/3 large subunit n=1 Tax=Stella humosa TaxID=94 RepID=A0A3N1KXD2_9PROT|nr:thiamine pyrophosphate-binding protein [Stella humosa]ROP84152.1 acetolactate synthase-1/2/3 large subunit [Stella humosa]BBK33662.1 acetolactate synthase [Stella humosa]
MTPLDALIRSLSRRGVRRIFGVPGGETSLDAIAAAAACGIEFVLARHETGAALMALATAEVTGAPGVVLTTRGPGLANAVNGIACAALERAPLCVISDGFTPEHRRFVSHQFFEHSALLAPIAKGSSRLDGEDAGHDVERLLDRAMAAPAGVVHFDVTGDAARRDVAAAEPIPFAAEATDEGALATARDLVAGAHRPILLCGLEAAADPALAAAVRAFAVATGAPALVTYKAKGVVADDDPAYVGLFTGGSLEAAAVAAADLIILAGLDPVELIPQPWRYAAPVIEVARQPFPLRYIDPAAGLYGTPAAALAALAKGAGRSGWQADAIARLRQAMLARIAWTGGGRLTPPDLVLGAQAAADAAGLDARATVDAGAHMFSATALWRARRPRDLLISNGLSTMGFALPAAIGAALAEPDRPVVAFTGDGGLAMGLGELATAAQTGARIVVVVFNDRSLSLIDIKQQHRQMRRDGVELGAVDFAAVASGLGVRGYRADDPTSYRAALDAAFAGTGPALVDAAVAPDGYLDQMLALRG